ncbi:MAG TPA: ArsI/CadI family heavy metal resistance metalloenzyme [Candidatus Kapabacteria bacterium]|nr:ArsI/CadI family heavy metal resistance metalloenzyme [Candidatus Kapabacteria bacterium]
MTALHSIPTLKAHVALNVRNVEESLAFYRAMFATEPVKVRTGYAKFDLDNPPLNFTLNENRVDGPGALSHMGIQVESTGEVLALRDLWAGRGLSPRDEMATTCCYAVQNKAWVCDPDGNEWEVFTVLKDNLPEGAGYDACCGSSDANANTHLAGAATDVAAPAAAPAIAVPVLAETETAPSGEACCAPGCC